VLVYNKKRKDEAVVDYRIETAISLGRFGVSHFRQSTHQSHEQRVYILLASSDQRDSWMSRQDCNLKVVYTLPLPAKNSVLRKALQKKVFKDVQQRKREKERVKRDHEKNRDKIDLKEIQKEVNEESNKTSSQHVEKASYSPNIAQVAEGGPVGQDSAQNAPLAEAVTKETGPGEAEPTLQVELKDQLQGQLGQLNEREANIQSKLDELRQRKHDLFKLFRKVIDNDNEGPKAESTGQETQEQPEKNRPTQASTEEEKRGTLSEGGEEGEEGEEGADEDVDVEMIDSEEHIEKKEPEDHEEREEGEHEENEKHLREDEKSSETSGGQRRSSGRWVSFYIDYQRQLTHSQQ
jgi:hypothetical protein